MAGHARSTHLRELLFHSLADSQKCKALSSSDAFALSAAFSFFKVSTSSRRAWTSLWAASDLTFKAPESFNSFFKRSPELLPHEMKHLLAATSKQTFQVIWLCGQAVMSEVVQRSQNYNSNHVVQGGHKHNLPLIGSQMRRAKFIRGAMDS